MQITTKRRKEIVELKEYILDLGRVGGTLAQLWVRRIDRVLEGWPKASCPGCRLRDLRDEVRFNTDLMAGGVSLGVGHNIRDRLNKIIGKA